MKTEKLDLSKFTSIGIGGEREIFIIESKNEISDFKDFFLLGGGNNILFSPEFQKPVLKLGENFKFIKTENNFLRIGASATNREIFQFAKKNNISGFEFLKYLPSSLGGLVKMNAGMKEFDTFQNLNRVRTEKGWISKSEIEFGYRFAKISGVIFEAEFEIKNGFSENLVQTFKNMRKNQPKEKSAGSTFKNPSGNFAGKLIEDVGLKGFKIGEMAFSPLHANFLINFGGGNFFDSIRLIELAEKRVFEKFRIRLQREIVVVN
ncbi:UDP-N-acetylenolpyruvoylglucosamine reductase [Thiovulum sp. ES]|nr:UDP-N-acetylenolpyruvoylglucosamine reductase [Thiovulum sp. ES]